MPIQPCYCRTGKKCWDFLWEVNKSINPTTQQCRMSKYWKWSSVNWIASRTFLVTVRIQLELVSGCSRHICLHGYKHSDVNLIKVLLKSVRIDRLVKRTRPRLGGVLQCPDRGGIHMQSLQRRTDTVTREPIAQQGLKNQSAPSGSCFSKWWKSGTCEVSTEDTAFRCTCLTRTAFCSLDETSRF